MRRLLGAGRGAEGGLRRLFGELAEAERWSEQGAADRSGSERSAEGGRPVGGAKGDPSYRVETRTEDGMHEVVGVYRRRKGGRLAPAELPDEELAELRSLVRSMLDLMGHEKGAMRTSVERTKGGLRIRGYEADSRAQGEEKA